VGSVPKDAVESIPKDAVESIPKDAVESIPKDVKRVKEPRGFLIMRVSSQ